MTASELIAELQKFPPHYTVMIVTTPGEAAACRWTCSEELNEWSFIGDVALETNMGAVGPIVKLVAEEF